MNLPNTRGDLVTARGHLLRGLEHVTSRDERVLADLLNAALLLKRSSTDSVSARLHTARHGESPDTPTLAHHAYRMGEDRVLRLLGLEGE